MATTTSLHDVTQAVHRVRAVLERRPEAGIHDDPPATARWEGGTRCSTRHANGTLVPTDMPRELGGSGETVTPGWLFRASLASCAATSIVLAAAAQEIALDSLEVQATSRSDARGLLCVAETDGSVVYGGPGDMELHIHIVSAQVSTERLHALVHDALGRSPIPCATRNATPLALRIDTGRG